MVSEKQIKKFVEDQKVLKLIDRMYTLQTINENQFDTVYSFVEEKGNSTTYERHYYVPDGEFKVEKKINFKDLYFELIGYIESIQLDEPNNASNRFLSEEFIKLDDEKAQNSNNNELSDKNEIMEKGV